MGGGRGGWLEQLRINLWVEVEVEAELGNIITGDVVPIFLWSKLSAIEDGAWFRKTTFVERQHLMEDDILWTSTFDER